MKKIVFLIIILVLSFNLVLRSENMITKSLIHKSYEIDKNISNGVLPFVVDTDNVADIYVDPVWGIHIEKVLVNGVEIESEIYDMDLDDLNLNVHSISSQNYVYTMPSNSLVFGKFENNDYHLLEFKIPTNFQEVSIYYRLSKTEMGLSKELNLLKVN